MMTRTRSIASSILVIIYAVIAVGTIYFVRHMLKKSDEDIPQKQYAVILAANDIYRINGILDGRKGGIARLKTLRRNLEESGADVLTLIAGDILSPSLLGHKYKGEQMVDLLNRLNVGPPSAFDTKMFVTFGNHEFDDSSCEKPQVLRNRVNESGFTWLAGNIDFTSCKNPKHMLDIPNLDNVKPYSIVELAGITVGLYGLSIQVEDEIENGKKVKTYPKFCTDIETKPICLANGKDQKENLKKYISQSKVLVKKLKSEGAEFIIAVTHLTEQVDKELLKQSDEDTPDLIIGGHDHHWMAHQVNGRWLYKADSEALTANTITLYRAENSKIKYQRNTHYLDHTLDPDLELQRVTDSWLERHEQDFCSKAGGLKDDCLKDPIGKTQVTLIAEEIKNRSQETNLGNWVTDLMADTCKVDSSKPTVAIINSGALRLNYDIPAGETINRRQLHELAVFPTPLMRLDISEAELWAAIQNGLNKEAEGGWAHYSGLAIMRDGKSLTGLKMETPYKSGKYKKINEKSKDIITLATIDWLIKNGKKDGYTFGIGKVKKAVACKFTPEGKTKPEKAGLKSVIANALKVAGDSGINPVFNGKRICSSSEDTKCLFNNS